MFKIESYVTPILLSYVDKYVRDFKPADAQVSLWGGGVALHNLVIKPDVLQQEVALPFTLISGRIHELLIQVPWTKIMSEPIVVTIDTIECILSLRPPTPNDESPPPDSPGRKNQVVEAPPGYMQALVRRIVSNITVRVHHLILKYVQDDIVLSLNVKHLSVDATGSDWVPAFADIDQNQPVIRRLVRLDDLTLCLDHCDSDGKIRFYQEPLLYRCQLDLRVLTRLVSANTRRARSLSIQLRSSKLAWGVTNDQLTLLLRLLKERPNLEAKVPPTASTPKLPILQTTQLRASVSNSAEPARTESWSEWAWSWLPTWMDREGGIEEAPTQATSTPIFFNAYLDDISLVYKVMEMETVTRKRARGILELNATHAAVKTKLCTPTMISTKVGARSFMIKSHGKCTCGFLSYDASNDKPAVYLMKIQNEESEAPWVWPEEKFIDDIIETAETVDKGYMEPEVQERTKTSCESKLGSENVESDNEVIDDFWSKMAPHIYMEFSHERSPPSAYTNPYDNPPIDFQYSDWEEKCKFDICLQPMEVKVSLGLLHRLDAFWSVYKELAVVTDIEPPRRLTLEERDALVDNLPQRRINVDVKGLRIRLVPSDHASMEKSIPPPLVLDLDVPKAKVAITGPLYPQRVCSAACQIPDAGPIWQGARLHVTGSFPSLEARICSPKDGQPKPCARTDLKFVLHVLLNQNLFTQQENVLFSYSLKTREINVSGSAARLMTALHIPLSLLKQRCYAELRYTTIVKDALKDEESVALDVTSEEFAVRGYVTKNVNTHILTLQTARATVFQKSEGNELKQAWLFSAPDIPSTTPFLRMALQWCVEHLPNSIDYVGIWTEPIAFCIDPLFIAWLAYRPTVKNAASEPKSHIPSVKTIPLTQFIRRKSNPPSSSGRGGSRSGSGAELVHNVRPRSVESKSEISDKKDSKPPPQAAKPDQAWLNGDQMIKMHERLRHILINVELGLVLVYMTMSTASAVDCASPLMAMERHAISLNSVLGINVGRWSLYSSYLTKRLWQEIKHDGPTFITAKDDQNPSEDKSFPWKLRIADVSCYTMMVPAGIEQSGLEKSTSGLRSQLKTTPEAIHLNTILELVTTTVTLSVVTKSLQYKSLLKKPEVKKVVELTKKEKLTRYFNTGTDFKPTTLKEFVRGPAKHTRSSADQTDTPPNLEPETKITSGPIVSFGFHVHADTPPIIIRLEHDQVHIVAAAVHCFRHILALLKRPRLVLPRHLDRETSEKSGFRSVSEMDEQQSQSESTRSESKSELIPIFDPQAERDDVKIKAFFWFQWVISRAALVVATYQVKLTFDIDDIISTIDLQEHYNQLKLKVASASIKHYGKTNSDEWTAGALGGRVLEAREPNNAKEENNFLAITVTQAQISNLPDSWKEELHPKLLQQKYTVDKVWEIYATLAPLEAVLQPNIVENIMSVVREMTPHSYCTINTEVQRHSAWQWPYCYISAGGLRLLVTCGELEENADDTLIFVCGKVTVNPHPENPICRRTINSFADTGWLNVDGGFEGRQYDMLIKNVGIRTSRFAQLVSKELSDTVTIKGGENPAHKWSHPVIMPVITPVLHSLDIGCVLAPALYVADTIVCGPGVELNLMSDCAIEISLEQMSLVKKVIENNTIFTSNRYELVTTFDAEETGKCPYTLLLETHMTDIEDDVSQPVSEVTVEEDDTSARNDIRVNRSVAADSGVDISASRSSSKSIRCDTSKTKMSVVFMEHAVNPSDYLEVFVTMGTIECTLYTIDDGSTKLKAFRPVKTEFLASRASPSPTTSKVKLEDTQLSDDIKLEGRRSNKSLTETTRNADLGYSNLDIAIDTIAKRACEGHVQLIYATFQQPNLYYWKKKSQTGVQISLFNAWVGLGAGSLHDHLPQVLLSTSRGEPDPVTEIPPALATMKLTAPSTLSSSFLGGAIVRGSLNLDIERPVLLEICSDRLMKLKGIINLVQNKLSYIASLGPERVQVPILYKVRRFMAQNGIETATITTSQIGVSSPLGTAGWDSSSLQVWWAERPERLSARALITALLVASGPTKDSRLPVLQPLQLGMELKAAWEAWRRAEGGLSAQQPTVRISVELDRVVIDLRPSDLAAIQRIRKAFDNLLNLNDDQSKSDVVSQRSNVHNTYPSAVNFVNCFPISSADEDSGDHYYKDDLRSGAFKIVCGGQLPMAYQVTLHRNAVSWRYPHPRAITRLIAFPIPGRDKEIECILELYNQVLSEWQPHSYFKVPVNDPSEIDLHISPPEAAFSTMWRVRVHSKTETKAPFEFNMNKFKPSQEPMGADPAHDEDDLMGVSEVTAEELSGVLRVDSYFAPRLLPRVRLSMRLTALEFHAHNSLLSLDNTSSTLEGQMSKPQMRCHRVLTLTARDAAVHANLESPAGKLVLINTQLSSDILDCATATIDQLVDEFRVQAGISMVKSGLENIRLRLRTSNIHTMLHVPRLGTLHALFIDWETAFAKCLRESKLDNKMKSSEENVKQTNKEDSASSASLQGRVSLWVCNESALALRVGQECTDEVSPLAPGAVMPYRWRSPTAVKKLRFALANPSNDWKWSNGVTFAPGVSRVLLEDVPPSTSSAPGEGVYAYVNVKQSGTNRYLHISGRLVLANMLRFDLHFKVRARSMETKTWWSLAGGEMASESVGRSVMCSSNCEIVLKIKLKDQNIGWSGDIPLKECPKENVPWLVKVPSEGDVPYMSVWCRVVRARSDGRILATIWPLYVLRSHLPLDTDVLIVTEVATNLSSTNLAKENESPPPLIHVAPGRGNCVHLLAPGTTSARHSLSFQYRNIECPVTREAVPLHYGVTDTSVFDKRAPVHNIEEVIQDIRTWLDRSGLKSDSTWPYSVVAKHWSGPWQPALLQPRCDVTARYQAVRAGGGCSLEVQLSPVLLMCNASPMTLTLRAHDASPLCKTEPGSAISLPSVVLQKPFFMSVETGREAFVSGQLEVCSTDPGQYGEPTPGQVVIDHSTIFAIQCNQKVALLTMYYEIKEDINILGIAAPFVLLNRLDTDIMVLPSAIAKYISKDVILRHMTFKVVKPCEEGSILGIPLCRFWLRDRWRGGNPSELNLFLSIALTNGSSHPASVPVPVRLGVPPFRRAVALIDSEKRSMAVLVIQHKHEDRWLVTVAPDPCPQFVVHNRTLKTLAIAQPVLVGDEPSASRTKTVPDCMGVNWWCILGAGEVKHYSSPAYCERYPPQPETTAPLPFLTFSRIIEGETEPSWCPPVAVAEGEQLVQLQRKLTAKLRVESHPHSTLIELKDVDETDISASDIRKRLDKPISDYTSVSYENENKILAKSQIGRVHDDDKRGVDNQGVIVKKSAQPTPSSVSLATIAAPADTRSNIYPENVEPGSEQICCVIASVAVEMAGTGDTRSLFALHLDRATLQLSSSSKKTKTTISIADIQIDNLQYDTGQYDFPVVATTRAEPLEADQWPALWNMFGERAAFAMRHNEARLLLKICNDQWRVVSYEFSEVTEIDIRLGRLALYIEDAYVTAVIELFQLAFPSSKASEIQVVLAEVRSLQCPLRFRTLYIHPLELTLTLHTAVRVYIALDQSPLHLGAFKLQNMMISTERLAHALTVHYLSAAILGAGWVVGGLELLGAPGALAARVGGATGGVRGIASAAAAALLRSLSAWAGSLARNLDLLAGDEEHARRAAAARRRSPDSFVAGLVAGITNFGINILGAVGGLAHHPLVGVAVGETESGAAALRRGLLGALTKPLSATADLVAYAGHGLLRQTGWDPIPQPRLSWTRREQASASYRRDCVRWKFRLSELYAFAGFEVLLDNVSLQLLITHKFLVIADESERIVEMIDFHYCKLRPFQASTVVELCVMQRRTPNSSESQVVDDDDEYQINVAAMARVARYTGAEGSATGEARVLSLLTAPDQAHALYATLAAAIHHNADSHFALL